MRKSLQKGLVQFWLNPNNEQDRHRLQCIAAWKQDKRRSFVDRMRGLIDQADQDSPTHLEQRMQRIEQLLQHVHERVSTGEIVLPTSETQTLQALVNLKDVEQWGV